MSDLISVIVPVYNAEKYLDKCIQSILGQTYPHIELLLIDDGSTDSSGSICDRYLTVDTRVRVFHKPNEGISATRNLGLDNANGDWIAFVDSDDWIERDMYEQMHSAAMNNKVEMVCCDLLMEHKDNSEVLTYNNEFDDHKLMYDCLAPISVEYFAAWNKLVSRRVYTTYNVRALNGPNMWEDVELMTKIRYFASSCCVVSKPLYHYNMTNVNSITSELKLLSRIEGQVERVKQVEHFFLEHGNYKKYKHFISVLKFQAKSDIFDKYPQKWISTFPEAKWSLHKLGHAFTLRMIIKFFLVSFFGKLGYYIIELCRR